MGSKKWQGMRKRKLLLAPAAGVVAVLSVAAAAYACTNYVGLMVLKGNNSGTGTVTVTGLQSWNEASQAMTQNVSSGIAKANKAQDGTNGNFGVWAGPRTDSGHTGNPWRLGGGASSTTLDVNFFDGGSTTDGYAYTNHTTWNNPTGDCMTWNVPVVQVTKLGTVTVNSSGNITGGAGTYFVSYASNWAWFKWPVANAKVSVSPKESGVCLSTSDSVNGNQGPITVL